MAYYRQLEESADAAWLKLKSLRKSRADSYPPLKNRLDVYFGDKLSTHFRLGLSTRGTILPRSVDEHSDIDYMIVFKDASSVRQKSNWRNWFWSNGDW
jgi:hypothetical protein